MHIYKHYTCWSQNILLKSVTGSDVMSVPCLSITLLISSCTSLCTCTPLSDVSRSNCFFTVERRLSRFLRDCLAFHSAESLSGVFRNLQRKKLYLCCKLVSISCYTNMHTGYNSTHAQTCSWFSCFSELESLVGHMNNEHREHSGTCGILGTALLPLASGIWNSVLWLGIPYH